MLFEKKKFFLLQNVDKKKMYVLTSIRPTSIIKFAIGFEI